MHRKKRTTINDIANYVGVHKTTVSRALNNPGRISPALSEKIKRAVIELNYIPNRAARTLHLNYSKTIALLIPSFENNVFNDVISGVKSVTDEFGYSLMVGTSTYCKEQEEKVIESYIQQSVDAFILTSTQHTERTINMLKATNVYVAEIMDMSNNPFNINYGVDQVSATEDMIKHLINQGYKEIAFCSLSLDPRAKLRQQGWRNALIQAKLDDSKSVQINAPASFETGAKLLTEVLTQWRNTEAIFFVSDELAAGAIMECHRKGIKVGEELAICGFNGLDISEYIYPSISTVTTPRYEMGKQATKSLVDLIEGVEVKQPIKKLSYELKIRDSA